MRGSVAVTRCVTLAYQILHQNEQLQAFATGSHPLYLENGVSATPQTQRRTERCVG